MSRLEKLKELYAAATMGEWKPCRDGEDFDGPYFEIEDEDRVEFEARPFTSIRSSSGTVAAAHDLFTFRGADAEFIALAHNLMPQLLEAGALLGAAREQFMRYECDGHLDMQGFVEEMQGILAGDVCSETLESLEVLE